MCIVDSYNIQKVVESKGAGLRTYKYVNRGVIHDPGIKNSARGLNLLWNDVCLNVNEATTYL